MGASQFGRGDERRPSEQDRKNQQSRDRMEDLNDSTRPGEITMADVQNGRR